MSRPRAAVVAPAFKERAKIAEVVRAVLDVDGVDEMIVVDDHSPDDTSEVARAAGATVVRHPRNMGAGAAIRTGLYAARDRGAEIGCVIAGDAQHIATDLAPMIRAVADGECDLAQGTRFTHGGRVVGANRFRTTLIRGYSLCFTAATGTRLHDATNGLRAIRLSILDDPRIDLDQSWLERYELEPYLLYRAAVAGYRIREYAGTVVYPQERGYTHMRPIVDWWKLFRPLVFLRLGIKS